MAKNLIIGSKWKVAGAAYIANVVDFGAKGDGVTDDTAAFVAAMDYVTSLAGSQKIPSLDDGNFVGKAVLKIPAGTFKITQGEALMKSTYTTRTYGLSYEGAGKGITQIWYANPSVTQNYLLSNNDAWLGISFSGISFIADGPASSFMLSNSNGGAQLYDFTQCGWGGIWQHVYHLIGGNNNSEMTWYACGFGGIIKKGIYVGPDGSDQFVNFNFYGCNFEVDEGDFIHMEKGGSIGVWGGSFIHIGANGGTFFKLKGGGHSSGTQRLLCSGIRVEHRVNTSKLIDTDWKGGNISFLSTDTTTSDFMVPTYVTAVFRSDNDKMPNIKFDGCNLMGKHEYQYNLNSFDQPHNVTYENCAFTHQDTAASFIVYTEIAGNSGGTPIIKFRNCRAGGFATETIFDCNLGHTAAFRGELEKKYLSVKGPSSSWPGAGDFEEVFVPINSIITAVRLYLPKDLLTSVSDNWQFKLITNELASATTPTVLGIAQGSPTALLKDGFNIYTEQFFVCDTDLKRKLKLQSNIGADQAPGREAYCIIEYLC